MRRDRPLVVPRGLSRQDAAAYVGVSASLFDNLVRVGRMPSPARLNGRLIWDRQALDRALDDLFDAPMVEAADAWSRPAP